MWYFTLNTNKYSSNLRLLFQQKSFLNCTSRNCKRKWNDPVNQEKIITWILKNRNRLIKQAGLEVQVTKVSWWIGYLTTPKNNFQGQKKSFPNFGQKFDVNTLQSHWKKYINLIFHHYKIHSNITWRHLQERLCMFIVRSLNNFSSYTKKHRNSINSIRFDRMSCWSTPQRNRWYFSSREIRFTYTHTHTSSANWSWLRTLRILKISMSKIGFITN